MDRCSKNNQTPSSQAAYIPVSRQKRRGMAYTCPAPGGLFFFHAMIAPTAARATSVCPAATAARAIRLKQGTALGTKPAFSGLAPKKQARERKNKIKNQF